MKEWGDVSVTRAYLDVLSMNKSEKVIALEVLKVFMEVYNIPLKIP